MQALKLWPTPVGIFEHPDFERINSEILKHDELRGANWFAKKSVWDLKEEYPILQEMYDWMLQCSAEYCAEHFGVEYRPEYFAHTHGFINYRGRGEEVMMHTHRLTTLAMTYYVNVTNDTGDIRLLDPRSTLGWVSIDAGVPYNQYTYKPKNGTMILFPGWVMHQVVQNQSDQERIALSSNVNLSDECKFGFY